MTVKSSLSITQRLCLARLRIPLPTPKITQNTGDGGAISEHLLPGVPALPKARAREYAPSTPRRLAAAAATNNDGCIPTQGIPRRPQGSSPKARLQGLMQTCGAITKVADVAATKIGEVGHFRAYTASSKYRDQDGKHHTHEALLCSELAVDSHQSSIYPILTDAVSAA